MGGRTTFYCGEIKQEYRGRAGKEEGVVITRQRGFLKFGLNSPVFGNIVQNTDEDTILRAYLGVNSNACRFIHDNYPRDLSDSPDFRVLDEVLLTEQDT